MRTTLRRKVTKNISDLQIFGGIISIICEKRDGTAGMDSENERPGVLCKSEQSLMRVFGERSAPVAPSGLLTELAATSDNVPIKIPVGRWFAEGNLNNRQLFPNGGYWVYGKKEVILHDIL